MTKKAIADARRAEKSKQKARKERGQYMGRSNAAYKLMHLRSPLKFSLERFRRLVAEKIGTPCRYCGDMIKAKTFSPDHDVPISRGGKSTLGNVEIICLKDNHCKGALTRAEYTALLKIVNRWDLVAKNDVLSRLRLGAAAKARWGRRWQKKT